MPGMTGKAWVAYDVAAAWSEAIERFGDAFLEHLPNRPPRGTAAGVESTGSWRPSAA
jgi:hypothetical protein